VKNRLRSFAYVLPIVELLVAGMIVVVPAVLSFIHFRQVAHGSARVSFESGGYVFTIPSDRFLAVGFDRAGWRAERPITILNTPAKFTETLVSLVIARKGYWWPPSLPQSTWHAVVYPIYALPAWIYIGFGIDALIGRRRIRRGNMILSVLLALTCAALFYGFRFGMPAAEREGQERLGWFIDGFALWAALFCIPVMAWIGQKRHRTFAEDEPLPS
jgi:hypothetical protein